MVITIFFLYYGVKVELPLGSVYLGCTVTKVNARFTKEIDDSSCHIYVCYNLHINYQIIFFEYLKKNEFGKTLD